MSNYRFLLKRLKGQAGCVCLIGLIIMQEHRLLLRAFCADRFIMLAVNCHRIPAVYNQQAELNKVNE